MNVELTYFETGTKEIKSANGELFFGDALLGEYIGVKNTKSRMPYFLIPTATVVSIAVEDLDEELYMVDVDSVRRSKELALRRISNDIDREIRDGRAFQ